MQLYFDFSGYSDMALGLARIFSIRFPLNFDSPYKATSITEYWQRWHMTLTRYITLYLYNPILLGIQRRRIAAGKKISRKALATFAGFTAMVAFPTLATMLLTGLWHGAGLQFLIFGLLHGIYLTANQAWRHFRQRHKGSPPSPPKGMLRMALRLGVYLQVSIALVFFRADSLHASFAMLRDLIGLHGAGHLATLLDASLGFALFPVVWFLPNTQQILGQESSNASTNQTSTALTLPAPDFASAPTSFFYRLRWSPSIRWSLVITVLFFAVLANIDQTSSFLYFQF
jgi:D-alanyl-lipoteichoic acid acyltransferase DltB (MBOAT superfamily)